MSNPNPGIRISQFLKIASLPFPKPVDAPSYFPYFPDSSPLQPASDNTSLTLSAAFFHASNTLAATASPQTAKSPFDRSDTVTQSAYLREPHSLLSTFVSTKSSLYRACCRKRKQYPLASCSASVTSNKTLGNTAILASVQVETLSSVALCHSLSNSCLLQTAKYIHYKQNETLFWELFVSNAS